eukprot:1170674-Amphidinium_carterae.1
MAVAAAAPRSCCKCSNAICISCGVSMVTPEQQLNGWVPCLIQVCYTSFGEDLKTYYMHRGE